MLRHEYHNLTDEGEPLLIRRKRPEPGTLTRPWRPHVRKWPRPRRDEWVRRILELFEAERAKRFETGKPGLTFRACEARVTLDMITEDLNREGESTDA